MLKKSGISIQIIILLFIMPGWIQGRQELTRSAFYEAMESDKLDQVNGQLLIIQHSTLKEKEAYEGALLMKKSGLIGGAGKKLNLFKSGRQELEKCIARDSMNAEFRFLRLMIQEHAPAFLGYKYNLAMDQAFILKYFKSLHPDVQDAVVEYSKKSKVLKPEDF